MSKDKKEICKVANSSCVKHLQINEASVLKHPLVPQIMNQKSVFYPKIIFTLTESQ